MGVKHGTGARGRMLVQKLKLLWMNIGLGVGTRVSKIHWIINQ